MAKVVSEITEKLSVNKTNDTEKILTNLNSKLASFDQGSLSKDVLKPLRDTTFHYYEYGKANADVRELLNVAVEKMKNRQSLDVGFDSSEMGLLNHRYIFANDFRSELIKQLLTTDRVAQLSVAAVEVLELADSLLDDLLRRSSSKSSMQ